MTLELAYTSNDFVAFLQSIEPTETFLIDQLAGGLVNVTVRATRQTASPPSSSPFASYPTFILKQAPPFVAAVGPSAPFTAYRQIVEVRALRLLETYKDHLVKQTGTEVRVPKVLYHDEEKHVLAITDLGLDLLTIDKWLLSVTDEELVDNVAKNLGMFMATVNTIPATNAELDSLDNPDSRTLIQREVVDKTGSYLRRFNVPEDKATLLSTLIAEDFGVRTQEVFSVGDFWVGSVLVNPTGTNIAVVDWEFAGRGRALQDMAQFCAYFNMGADSPNRMSQFVIALNTAYGERSGGIYDSETIRSAWILHGREVLNVAAEGDEKSEEERTAIADIALGYLETASQSSINQEDLAKEKILQPLWASGLLC
ncbi:kinase-like domain-containing protein [Flagelloscypha sp. PMI_526]|nr:kinase-like domain-containing protein [Flagelloscypha sp. PMI_526]